MPEHMREQMADSADMIVDGYAYQKYEDNIRVVNLNTSRCNAIVMTKDGKVLEGDMDPIEEKIAIDTWLDNAEFMEV